MSVSGSPTAGLWILYLHSGLPALLTDALTKDETELHVKHGRAYTPAHVTGTKTQLLKKGHFIACDSKG